MDRMSYAEKIKQLEDFAVEKGAYKARAFSASGVVIDDRVRMKCQIPLCPHYGQTLTCPPNIPTVDEFRKALVLYKEALLIQTRSPITGEINAYDKEQAIKFFTAPGKATKSKGGEKEAGADDFHSAKVSAILLNKLVNEVEGRAMAMGFPYALGLIGGECMLCYECVGANSKQACRRPYEARPSMEGVGIDCIKTSIEAGLPFDIPPKKEIIWSGLILID